MRHYAIGRKDGGVTVMSVVDGFTVEGEVARWPQDMRDAIAEIVEINTSDIPTDRSNRDAWTLRKGKIVIRK